MEIGEKVIVDINGIEYTYEGIIIFIYTHSYLVEIDLGFGVKSRIAVYPEDIKPYKPYFRENRLKKLLEK